MSVPIWKRITFIKSKDYLLGKQRDAKVGVNIFYLSFLFFISFGILAQVLYPEVNGFIKSIDKVFFGVTWFRFLGWFRFLSLFFEVF